jgi:ubiquinone/menaquinone biosynthesis C-methylase UbiE
LPPGVAVSIQHLFLTGFLPIVFFALFKDKWADFFGSGPGAFIPGLAELVGPRGTVIAIDLQEEMLQRAREKVRSAGFLDRVRFHRCGGDSLDIDAAADFALPFYIVHEAPDPLRLIDQVCALLKPGPGSISRSPPSTSPNRTTGTWSTGA